MTEAEESEDLRDTPPEENAFEVSSLEKDLKECQEKYLRLLAESENSRKRLQKEKQETIRYAVENVLCEILHPIDSMEKALKIAQSMSDEVKNWAYGFEMILGQFKQSVANHGITPFKSEGAKFDPNRHEAVEVVETTEHPSGIVIQEFLVGYQSGDRVIRPARVKVSKNPEVKKETQESTSKE